MFITSTRYLEGKDLTNLIGRVNRLNYVFQENNLEKLNPKIHFLNKVEFQKKDSVRNKIELLRNHSFKDVIENPLLLEYNIDNLNFAKNENETKEEVKQRRRLKDENTIKNTNFLISNDSNYTIEEKIKKYLIENNIDDFFKNIDNFSSIISRRINLFKNDIEWGKLDLIEKIHQLFILGISDFIVDYEIERLKNDVARKYYNYYLEKTQKQPLKININSTFKYLVKKANSNDPFLFIGKSYGDITRYSNFYNNNKYKDTVYVNLKGKPTDKLINLSIVKLKIEDDFVSFKLNKFIVFLYDFALISEDEYYLHTYGTNNKELIKLARLGLSLNIVNKLLADNQFSNLVLDDNGNLNSNQAFDDYLKFQSELFKFEVNKYL